jgi:DNA-directed RNA polymerase subunit RPC12/RpoP
MVYHRRAECANCGARFPLRIRLNVTPRRIACPACHVVQPLRFEPVDERWWKAVQARVPAL